MRFVLFFTDILLIKQSALLKGRNALKNILSWFTEVHLNTDDFLFLLEMYEVKNPKPHLRSRFPK